MGEKSKKIYEAFGLIILAVILLPVTVGLIDAANITGTVGTVLGILPTLLVLLVVLAMFKDSF